MTDKERLEEIGKRAKHRVLENSRGEVRYRFTEINTEDFKWLFEQAGIGINTSRDKQALIKSNIALNKRVQELERELEEHKSKFTVEYTMSLRKRNKRYRKALEFYARGKHVAYKLDGTDDDLVVDYGETARQALEGEE